MDNQHKLIIGYRELSIEEITAMNTVKEQAASIEALCNEVRNITGVDQRWVSIAVTDLQKGFMALTRAIAKPTSF